MPDAVGPDLVRVAMLALASFGATLLLARHVPSGGGDMKGSLLRLGQALPLPIGFLYAAWWVGPAALALGIGAGLAVAPFARAAAVPLGVATLAAGLSYAASIIAGIV